MSRRISKSVWIAPLCALAGAAALSACTPITASQGYQVIDERPGDIKVGTDTVQTVRTRFGSPTVISTFEPNVWFYISQINDSFGFYRPHVRDRQIVQVTFDKSSDKVTALKTYTAKDGKDVAYNTRETPTRGRELSVLQQVLGTLGATPIPPQEDDPGAPGQSRR